MKQLNNTKSEVYLSTYDNSDTLLPVSDEYKGIENICVAVKFGDTVIKISPKDTCKCSWDEAVKNHANKLMNPAFWQMVGNVSREVNRTLKILSHDPIDWVWTDAEDNNPEYSGISAWLYFGTRGSMTSLIKYNTYSVRTTKVFKI